MNANISKNRSLLNWVLLLFGLSVPLWVIGAIYDVQLFPGFNLLQLPLAMPAVAALILIYRESGRDGVAALLKRTYDFRNINSKIWYLPILLLYPGIVLVQCGLALLSGVHVPPVQVSFRIPVTFAILFIAALGEESGWMGYAFEPLQERFGALKASLFLGSV